MFFTLTLILLESGYSLAMLLLLHNLFGFRKQTVKVCLTVMISLKVGILLVCTPFPVLNGNYCGSFFFLQSVFNISERAMQYILRFLKFFLNFVATNNNDLQIKEISVEIPLTTKTAVKLLEIQDNGIIEYVVCPKCHSLYEYEDCLQTLRNGKKESKLCCYVQYPSHPNQSRREHCNTLLLKTMQKDKLKPFLSYPYYPLHLSFCRLDSRPGF